MDPQVFPLETLFRFKRFILHLSQLGMTHQLAGDPYSTVPYMVNCLLHIGGRRYWINCSPKSLLCDNDVLLFGVSHLLSLSFSLTFSLSLSLFLSLSCSLSLSLCVCFLFLYVCVLVSVCVCVCLSVWMEVLSPALGGLTGQDLMGI